MEAPEPAAACSFFMIDCGDVAPIEISAALPLVMPSGLVHL